MLRNYLKIAYRTLLHDKVFTIINAAGLGVALVVVIFFLIYQRYESSFDQFHTQFDKIYRVIQVADHPEQGKIQSALCPPALGTVLTDEFSQVKEVVSINVFGQSVMYVGDSQKGESVTSYNERNYLVTNEDFFKVFSYSVMAGDILNALTQPNQVVLTKRAALKYFGHTEVIGNSIQNNRTGNLDIVAIVDDPPPNSHLDFDFIISISTLTQTEQGRNFFSSWESSNTYHYLVTKQELSSQDERNLLQRVDAPVLEESGSRQFQLQHIGDIHLNSAAVDHELTSANLSKRNPLYLNIFRWITLLTLLIACINYINLATARSLSRIKEIAVRKVIGASQPQLFTQFIAESILTTLFGGLLAIVLIMGLRNYLAALVDIPISLADIFAPTLILTIPLLLIIVGFASGFFPAVILSQIKPANSFRGSLGKNLSKNQLRKSLSILQFTIAIAIVSATIFMNKQLSFIKQKDLGFAQEYLVTIDINSGTARSSFREFKEAFGRHASVLNVSATSRVPGEWKNIPQVAVKKIPRSSDSTQMHFFAFDEDALATFDMTLVEGLNFSGHATDSSAVILNQTAVSQLGLKNPVGSAVYLGETTSPLKVIGVVEDFHLLSLHESMPPVIIGGWLNPIQAIDYFTCKTTGNQIPALLAHLETIQRELDPDTPLEYHFLDEQIERFYKEEKQLARILLAVALLTLTIACMGLFGMVTYNLNQRTKEVGVRKVLGAESWQIWLLLAKDVIYTVIFALILAIPICWYFLAEWLRNFAYAIKLNPIIFFYTGILVVLMAILSIQYHLMQLVKLDPVTSLRED